MKKNALLQMRQLFAWSTMVCAALCGCRSTPKVVISPPVVVKEPTAFDIPNLNGITIDGDPTDWANLGYAVKVMRSTSSTRPSTDQFDAQIRLAWHDGALLLLADVTDSDIRESDDDLVLAEGASIEVGETNAKGQENFRITIAPGIDPKHPRMRIAFYDERSKTVRVEKLFANASVKKTARGFILEAQLPIDMPTADIKSGSEFGLVVRVNQPDGDRPGQLEWSAAPSVSSPKKKRLVRLANDAHPETTLAVDVRYERLRRTRIFISELAEKDGSVAEIKNGDEITAKAILKKDGRLASADFSLPIPVIRKPSVPLTLWLDGKPAAPINFPDADAARKDAVADLHPVAAQSVFTQCTFPEIDFLSPGAVEDLIGNYTLHTTFYDVDYNVVTRADRPGRYGAVVEISPQHGKPFKRYVTLYRAPTRFNLRPLRLKTDLEFPAKIAIDSQISREQLTATGDFIRETLINGRRRDELFSIYLAGLSEIAPGAGDLPPRLGPFGRNVTWWYGLQKKLGDLVGYKYLVHVPDPKLTTGPTKLPLILFLHGSGQRGSNVNDVAANGLPKILKNDAKWPYRNQFIVVSPQCPAGETWNPLLLRDVLDKVAAKYPVDLDRVYLTGLSLGGFGTWDLAGWFPEKFAAIAPVCGGGEPADVPRLKDIPTWIFHGERDSTVRIESAYEMVKCMRDAHARVRFTAYPEYGHNCWDPAYDENKLYDWFLQQRRGEPAQPRSQTPDTQPAED